MKEHPMSIYKRISMLCLTLTLAFVFGCAATSTKEGTGEYIDDSAITAKVKSGLLGEPNLNSNDIQVETFKGVVQLSGFVTSTAQINTAVAITRKVKGVSDVRSNMVVKGQQ
jgi:osmotically-inducible protein OsmY